MITPQIEPGLIRLTRGIIGRWGLSEIARRVHVPRPQNVARWRECGNIPTAYRKRFIRMAAEDGKFLSQVEMIYLTSREKIPTMRQLAEHISKVSVNV